MLSRVLSVQDTSTLSPYLPKYLPTYRPSRQEQTISMQFFQMRQLLSDVSRILTSSLHVPQQHVEFDQLARRPPTLHAGRDDINSSVLLRLLYVPYRYQQ